MLERIFYRKQNNWGFTTPASYTHSSSYESKYANFMHVFQKIYLTFAARRESNRFGSHFVNAGVGVLKKDV